MDIVQLILTSVSVGLLLWLWFFLILYFKSKNAYNPEKKKFKYSKSQTLTYIVVFLWVIYGVLAIWQNISLEQLAGYYASLTLFISTYLWGEFRRSSKKTDIMSKGKNSSRQVIIYVVLFLWAVLGAVGIFILDELNSLTVYFGSLSPFVMSYIIYKTTKGHDYIPEFDEVKMDNVDTDMSNQPTMTKNNYESDPGYYDDVDV